MRRTQTHKTTLVLGSTGKTGRRVAKRLREQGALVRDGSRSGQPPFDWEDTATWTAVLEGLENAYVSYYPDLSFAGAAEAVGGLAKAAVEAGVRRLVLLSGRGRSGRSARGAGNQRFRSGMDDCAGKLVLPELQ